jgi:cytochrome b561
MATVARWDPKEPLARSRYSTVAIFLHWAIAALILYNLTSGLLRGVLPRGFFQFHTSSGLTILALTALRIAWRLTHRPPPLLPMAKRERYAAHAVHFLLYVMMVALPVTGWIIVSSNPPPGSPGAEEVRAEQLAKAEAEGKPAPPPRPPAKLWMVAPFPYITPIREIGREPAGLAQQRKLHDDYEQVHGNLGWIMLVLLILHIGGALKHQWLDRLPELERMGLGRQR